MGRSNANLDNNARQGTIASDNITGVTRVVTGRSLTNSVPMDIALVNTSGSQIGDSGSGAVTSSTERVVVGNDAGKNIQSASGVVSGTPTNTIVGAGTNRLKVFAFTLSTVSTTAVVCTFSSGGATELWRVELQTPANVAGGANLVVQPPAWIFATAVNTVLVLGLSVSVNVHYSVSYFDEA